MSCDKNFTFFTQHLGYSLLQISFLQLIHLYLFSVSNAQTVINRGVEVVLSSEQSRLEEEQYLELNKPQISDRSSELSASELRAIEDLEFERRNPPVDEPDPNEMGEADRRALEALL